MMSYIRLRDRRFITLAQPGAGCWSGWTVTEGSHQVLKSWFHLTTLFVIFQMSIVEIEIQHNFFLLQTSFRLIPSSVQNMSTILFSLVQLHLYQMIAESITISLWF